jgi:HlyD family secretion protein
MKRSIWVAVCVIVVAVLAATYYYRRDVEAEAPAFTTAAVSRGDVVSTVDATGTLEAVTTVQVGSQLSGTISALHADFNSEVRKGQIIAELDASLFETQVEQAKATVVRLQADADRAKVQAADAALKLKRARELFDKQLIPATDLETAESTSRAADAAVKGAEAQVVQAQASLNQAQVKSHDHPRTDRRRGHRSQCRRRANRRIESAGPDALRHRARSHGDACQREHR